MGIFSSDNHIPSALKSALLTGVILLLLSLPAMHPFLQGNFPLTDDGTLHLYRTIALDHALQSDAVIYPRYAPGLVYGYGSPLFNFFPPVPYYLPLLLSNLFSNFVSGWLGAMVIYTFMASLGAFLLGRSWSNTIGGYITAVAYIYAPYMLFDAVARGTLIEYAGLAGLPFILWGLTRLAQNPSLHRALWVSIIYAFFIPLHNIVTVHGSYLLAFFGLILLIKSPQKVRMVATGTLVAIIGVSLTAYFWMPALGETDQVKINAITESLASIDVTNTLRPISDSLAFPITADDTQLQQPVPIAVSWISLYASFLGFISAFRLREKRTELVGLTAITVFALFMTTPPSAPLWNLIPFMDYTQFAWRILGIASLTLALMTGISVSLWVQNSRFKMSFIAFITIGIIAYGIPWMYRPHIELPAETITDAQDYERISNELSLSSYSEYLPITNITPLDANALISRYTENDIIPRIDTETLPDGVTITNARWTGTQSTFTINAENETRLTFDWLHTPAWIATNNTSGESLTIFASEGQGLVSVEFPAGEYSATVQLSRTSTQQTADTISLLALIAWSIITLWTWQSRPRIEHESHTAHISVLITFAVVGLGMFVSKVTWIETTDNPLHTRQFVNRQHQAIQNPSEADFSGLIRILGSEYTKTQQSGESVNISLFWTLQNESINQDFTSRIELRDSNGFVVAESESFQPANRATSNWIPDTYLIDAHTLDISDTLTPDTYDLFVSLYNPENLQALNIIQNGNPIGINHPIGALTLTRPESHSASESLATFDAIALASISALPEQAQNGDEFQLTWQWNALERPQSVFSAKLLWLDDNGAKTAENAPTALISTYPTTEWQAGDSWQGRHRLYIPADLASGTYTIAIQVLANGDIIEQYDTEQTITVTAPTRITQRPDGFSDITAEWQNGIQLIGYEISDESLNLLWRTDSTLPVSYRFFVQQLDNDDNILRVSDGIPVNWQRPTTSWNTQEFITTSHPIEADSSTRFRIGWYDPITEQRALLTDEQGEIIIDFGQ